MVLVAKIGATVAAATGVPVLKIVFWRGEIHNTVINKNSFPSVQLKSNLCLRYCEALSKFGTTLVLTQAYMMVLPPVVPAPWCEAAVSASLMRDVMAV